MGSSRKAREVSALFFMESGEATGSIDGPPGPAPRENDCIEEISLLGEGTWMPAIIAAAEMNHYQVAFRDFRRPKESNGVISGKPPQRRTRLFRHARGA